MREKFGALPEAVEARVRSMEDTVAMNILMKRVLWAESLDAMELNAGIALRQEPVTPWFWTRH